MGSSTFTISSHGLFTGNTINYSRNGNVEINGLSDNGIYYVQVANINQFNLFNDSNFQYPARINAPGTGTHQLIKNPEEFFINDILSSHSTYQKLTLASGSYTFEPGRVITGTVDVYTANAYVYSWNSSTRELIISNEYTNINGTNERVKFTADFNSTIDADHATPANAPIGGIAISSVVDYTGLWTATIFPKSTIEGGLISSISGLQRKRVAFHRPSIVNSSAHTWEYAGSGTDYNALPQNGGVPKPENEQYSEAPGRVYVSGTNELGDFKVGNFIVAENRSGLITFKSKVTVGELNVLKLTLSAVAINQISADVGLGDNEPGGASNQRLSTQKAVRSFFANRLGSVIDKSVSTNSVPGALVQLNASGQINADLLPPQKAVTTYQVDTWKGRLSLYNKIPPVDVQVSDQANERYQQRTLTLTGNVTVAIGQVVTQANRTGTGVVKYVVAGTNSVTIANSAGTFSTNTIDTIFFDGVDSTYYPSNTGANAEQSETYYLAQDNKSQFLVLATGAWSFTNGNTVVAATSLAQGQITEYRAGVLYGVNNTGIAGGAGYQPAIGSVLYTNVPLVSTGAGVGTGAIADITVTSGAVTNVAVNFGGSGYAVGDVLSASTGNIGGGFPTSTFTINVARADTRLYVDLTGNNIKFSSPDYIQDNNAVTSTLADLTYYLSKSFSATSIASGGNVDYSNSRITITSHGFTNGDPVVYSSGVNIAIGNLTSNTTYFAKVIDSSTIELYSNYNLANKLTFGLSQTGTHSVRRYAVNTENFFFTLPAHGFTTATPVKIIGTTPPGGITSNSYFYIGSVTTNAFSLHVSRADALSSINGSTINQYAITSTGAGSLDLTVQNVLINSTLNTSSKSTNNWNNLTATTIDAAAIVSGTVSPTRLANNGTANNQTFLRGDSSWAYATASAKAATDSPLTITGDFDTRSGINYYHGDLTFDVNKVNPLEGGPNFTNYGVAAFAKSQFTVLGGTVTITAGAVDAGTLGGFTGSYYLTPDNFQGTVPITKGGTNLTTYTKGDILYSSSNNTLAPLNIGLTGQVLNVDISGIPAWSDSINLPGSVTVQSTTQSNGTTSGSIKTDGGLGVAKNANIGGNLNVDGNIVGTGSLTVNSTDKNVSLQPTGTGTVVVYPSTKGTIDNLDIGSTVAGTAKFTTLEASGNTKVTANTSSTTTGTGALVVSGGLGVGENLNVSGNTIIGGNLTVNGTTTTVNSTTTTIQDPMIDIGGGLGGVAPSTNDNKDRGIKFQWHNGTVAKTGFFGYKSADGYLEFIPDASITGDVATGSLGDIKAATFRGNLTSSSVTITGGTINNTTIGATNANTGAFTTLTSSGATTFTANTSSVDTTTGTLVVTGGVGISGAVNIGGAINTGAATVTGLTDSALTSGRVTYAKANGELTDSNDLRFNGTTLTTVNGSFTGTLGTTGNFTVNTNKFSVTATSGDTSVAGTLGVTGATTLSSTLGVTGAVTLSDVTQSTSTLTGAITVAGGIGIAKNAWIGGTLNAGATTVSSLKNSALTAMRVVFAGTDGLLTDTADLTYNGFGQLSTYQLIVNSGAEFKGNVSVRQLTQGRITFTGADNTLTDSSNLTFDTVTGKLTGLQISAGDLTATTSVTFNTSGTVTINPSTAGAMDNVVVGATTAKAGTFTDLTANTSASLSPTGLVTINPGTTSNMDNVVVGATTAKAGTFTALTVNTSASLSPTGTVTLNPGTTSSIDNMSIGATTRSSGAFTTLAANNTVSFTSTTESSSSTGGAVIISGGVGVAKNLNVGGSLTVNSTTTFTGSVTTNGVVNLNPANANVSIAPTGTGIVTINPGSVGTLDNVTIGASTARAATFTTLTATGNTNLNGNNSTISISPTGSGYVTINPTALGSIDNMTVGATTASTGRFTTLTATTSANFSPSGTITLNPTTASSIDNMSIGTTTRSTGAFTTLASNGATTFTAGTSSSSTTSGSVVVTGGVGVSENLYVGGTINAGAATFTNITNSGLTAGRVTFAGTSGLLSDSSTLTFASGTLTVGTSVVAGGVTVGTANITLTGGNITGSANITATGTIQAATIKDTTLTSGRITYATTGGELTDSASLTFNGTTLTAGGFTTSGSLSAAATTITTLGASGVVTVTNTTESTSTSDGSIVTSGGVGIAKNLNVGGSVAITGNLTVNGTTTTVNSIVSTVKDPIIDIGGGIGGIAPTSNDSKDRGVTFQYFDSTAKRGFFGYNAQNGRFKYIANATLTGEVATGDLGDLEVGTIYGNVVGGINLTGALAITDTTDSTDQYTGSINTDGGLGVAKRLNVGDSAQFGLNNNNYAKIEGAQSGLPVILSALGTDTNVTIKIVPQGAGLVIIDSTKALTIPTGNTAARPANAPNGSIRFNDQTTQFEGYNGVGWASLGGVKSVDGKTYIIPEATAGSSDDTLYFYTNDFQAGTWTSDRLTIKSKGFKVPSGGDADRPASPIAGDFRFNTDAGSFEGYASGVWSGLGGVKSVDGLTYIKAEATPGASDDTLYFYSNGSQAATLNATAGLQVGNVNLFGRKVSATDTNGSLELAGNGNGLVKILGTGAVQIPSGTTDQRISGSAGYIRYNNETRNLEFWDHVGNVWKTSGGGGSGSLTDNAGDTYLTFETNGNDEKVIRFYVGAGQPGNATQGSVQIANISKENGLLISGKISILNNVIQNITNNEDLIIRATGTGRVVIDGAGSSAGGGNVFATDPIITLNSSVDTGVNTYDSGFIIRRGGELNAGFIWSEVGDEFRAINTTNVGTTRGTITEANYATVATASVKLTTETANKVTFTDNSKIVRSLDTGRTAQVDGVMRFNPDAQLGIPYGTIIDRPDTPVDGSLRYNTTTALFEGFAEGGWQNMGIGTGSAPTKQSLIGDGTASSFQLNQTPLSTAGIAVIIDNQILEPDYDYTLTGSGDVLQLLDSGQGTYVPTEGTRIDIRYLSKPAISTVRDYEYTGDGIETNFATDFAIYAKPDVLVFVNSVYVGPAGYSILGNEVILANPPANGIKVNLVHLCTITAPDITTRAESQDDAIAFAIALG